MIYDHLTESQTRTLKHIKVDPIATVDNAVYLLFQKPERRPVAT